MDRASRIEEAARALEENAPPVRGSLYARFTTAVPTDLLDDLRGALAEPVQPGAARDSWWLVETLDSPPLYVSTRKQASDEYALTPDPWFARRFDGRRDAEAFAGDQVRALGCALRVASHGFEAPRTHPAEPVQQDSGTPSTSTGPNPVSGPKGPSGGVPTSQPAPRREITPEQLAKIVAKIRSPEARAERAAFDADMAQPAQAGAVATRAEGEAVEPDICYVEAGRRGAHPDNEHKAYEFACGSVVVIDTRRGALQGVEILDARRITATKHAIQVWPAPEPQPAQGDAVAWVRPQRDFEKWAAACVNGPETLRAIEGAYGQGWVDRGNATPPPAPEALPASLLPLAQMLLRDAQDALGNTGGMRVGMPKATVDANRLRNVAAAVVAHLRAQAAQGVKRG